MLGFFAGACASAAPQSAAASPNAKTFFNMLFITLSKKESGMPGEAAPQW
jgi:hypothetical protein